MPGRGSWWRAGLLFAVGLLLLAAGITYFVLPAGSLPALMPGHRSGESLHLLPAALFSLFGAVTLAVLAALSVPKAATRDRSVVVAPRLGRPAEPGDAPGSGFVPRRPPPDRPDG